MVRRVAIIALLALLRLCMSLRCRQRSGAVYRCAAVSTDHFDSVLDGDHGDDDFDDDFNTIQESRWATTKYQTTYSQQPSFFPRTIDELALDCRDSTQIAFISNIKRIRVDIRMRITEKNKQMLMFLIRYVHKLLDDEIKSIKVLVDDSVVEKARQMWRAHMDELSSSPSSDRAVTFVPIKQSPGEADLYVVHRPDADKRSPGGGETEDYYGSLQKLCEVASDTRVPVIFINPANMARVFAPSALSLDSPLLINDFANAYFVCDDYFMISNGDKYMGLVQRAGLGTDLYLLEGFRHLSPKRYRRLDTYSRQPLPMDNVRDRINRVIIDDPDSPIVKVFQEVNRRAYDAGTDSFIGRHKSVEGGGNIASFIKAFQGRQ